MLRTSTSYPVVPRGRLDSPFFQSKFRIPNDPRHFVPRPRLLSLLDDLSDYPVTAIVAPAGAGKTALAADWLRHDHRPSAWLSIDAADSDPAQFWRSVSAVLQPLAAGHPVAVDEGPHIASQSMMPDTGVSADAAGTTMTLVIDDLDRLDEDERACAALQSLVLDRPPAVRLLLLSRRRLPLPVERLRAAGELADIHFDALRFSPDEASDLLTSLCPDIPVADLPAVVDRAGGWTAALKLTALSIRSGHSASAFSRSPQAVGPDALIDEYLWQEVLRGERPELIRMLLATAVVGRVNYGLAEVLTGRPDAGDLLEEAEDRGLFVTSLDDGGWFQVHALIRDMLLAKYERRWPMGLREQHARAARWFESKDDHLTALDHWRRAERPADVLRALADAALSLVDSGQEEMIARVIDDLPPEVAGSGHDALVRYAWCALLVDQMRFRDALAEAERVVGDHDVPAEPRLTLLRAAAASLSGDWDECERLAGPALAHLRERGVADPVSPFGWTLMALAVALGERWNDEAELVGAVRIAVTHDADQRLAFESTRVLGLALAGRPLDARRAAVRLGPVAEDGRLPRLRIQLALADAIVAAEMGDRERARCTLVDLSGSSTYPIPSLQVVAKLELAQVYVATGHIENALSEFDGAETLTRALLRPTGADPDPTASAPASWLRSSLARVGVALSLATDNVDAAAEWTQRVADPFWGPMCEAKVCLVRGDHQGAAEALTSAEPRSVRHEVVHHLVCARATAGHDQQRATASVAAALHTAAEHGLLQTVASEGTEVLELVELSAWRVPDAWMERLRHFLVPTWEPRADALVEPLTQRERDVLRLLPSRLTLREIASQLYVSQNTLKFHVRAIYRKLGVDSRAAAVHTARQLRLLPGG
jgi:LuxR family maltose regulon positive regulatory protein